MVCRLQAEAVVQTGALGQIAGFNIFEDATLPDTSVFIVGHPNWCTRIEEWAVPVRLQSLEGSGTFIGASAVQGRKIYKHAVTKSSTLLIRPTMLDPVYAIDKATDKATITSTGSTSIKYRLSAAATPTVWGDWTDYSAAISVVAGDKLEAYGLHTDGTKTITVSRTVAAGDLT